MNWTKWEPSSGLFYLKKEKMQDYKDKLISLTDSGENQGWVFSTFPFLNFREESIWSNVILIVKQPGPGLSSLERGSQGAEEAAKMFCPQGISQSRKLGFSYLDDSVSTDFKEVLESLGIRKMK